MRPRVQPQGAVSGAELPDELHQLRGEGDGLHRPEDDRRHNADLLHTSGEPKNSFSMETLHSQSKRDGILMQTVCEVLWSIK